VVRYSVESKSSSLAFNFPAQDARHARFHLQGEFGHSENLLVTETDAEKTATIRSLLAEEKAKLAEFRPNRRRSDAAE